MSALNDTGLLREDLGLRLELIFKFGDPEVEHVTFVRLNSWSDFAFNIFLNWLN